MPKPKTPYKRPTKDTISLTHRTPPKRAKRQLKIEISEKADGKVHKKTYQCAMNDFGDFVELMLPLMNADLDDLVADREPDFRNQLDIPPVWLSIAKQA